MITKIILGLLALLVVLLVVAVLLVGSHLDALVKAGLETVGPRLTQTTLTVDAVHLSLFSGSAAVNGLVLGNPEGFKAPQSISLSNAAVRLAPGSVLSQKILIHSVELRALEITFEGNPFGKNNLSQIMANVNASAAPVDRAGANAPAPATPAEKKAAKKFEVDDLVIAGAKIHANLTGIVNREVTLPLPDIHLTNLGTGTDGITAADLTQKVLSEISAATVKTLVSYATDLGKGAAGAVQGAAKGALENSSNAVNQGLERLKKGLFGK